MTAEQEQEMHALAVTLEQLTRGTGWEAMRYQARRSSHGTASDLLCGDLGEAMSYEATTVAAKLRDSLAAHAAALEARHRKDFAVATVELRRAYTLRGDAHNLDPEHTLPAWQEEDRRTPQGRNTHDDLMAFYAQQLESKETTDADQPAAESPAQPVQPEPIAANATVADAEQPAAKSTEPQHSATARVTAKRLQRKARHG